MTVHPTQAAFAPAGVAWMAFGRDGMTWSPGLFHLLGLPETGFAPSLDLLMSFVIPEDRSARQHIVELADGRRLDRILVRIDRRDGHMRQLAVMHLEVVDGAGERRLCVFDLTDDRDRDREAGETRNLVSVILGRTSDGIIEFGRDGIVARASVCAARILGSGPLEGVSMWDRFPGLAADPIGRFAQEPADGSAEDERWIPALNRWLSYAVVATKTGCVLVFRDRDEVVGLRTSIMETAERWSAAVASAGAALFEADPAEDRMWLTGEPGPRTRRVTPARIEMSDHVEAEDRPRLRAALRAAAATGDALALDIHVSDPGGARLLRLRALPTQAGAARPGRLVGLAFDLSSWTDPPPEGSANSLGMQGPGLTGGQVRAARGALRWSVRELAELSGVSVATINRFEAGSRTVTARDCNVAALEAILTARGIAFFRQGDRPALVLDATATD